MRQRLTKRSVEALRPAERPYEVRDTVLPGFLVRVQPSGSKSFYFTYSFNGRRGQRVALGKVPNVSVDGARQLATAAAGAVAAGRDPHGAKKAERAEAKRARVSTLERFLADVYEPQVAAHLKSGAFQVKRIRADFAAHLSRPMSALSVFVIEGLRRDWLKGGKQPKTINRDLQRLRGVLSEAVRRGVLKTHPLADLKPLKVDRKGRTRFLSATEEAALRTALDDRETRMREERERYNEWRAARHMHPLPTLDGSNLDHLRPLTLLALNCGLRRGELFGLLWTDVRFEDATMHVRAATAKSGQSRDVPLNAEALEVLRDWNRRQGRPSAGLVFPSERDVMLTRIDKAWRGVTQAAKLDGFNFHDCRHTFASRLVANGVPLYVVKELLGHASIAMTERYSHLEPNRLRAAVELVKSVAA